LNRRFAQLGLFSYRLPRRSAESFEEASVIEEANPFVEQQGPGTPSRPSIRSRASSSRRSQQQQVEETNIDEQEIRVEDEVQQEIRVEDEVQQEIRIEDEVSVMEEEQQSLRSEKSHSVG
jgi:hypothetical protein